MKNQKEKATVSNLREALKEIMKAEIQKLPETLEALEPKERVQIVCKLMPFVFPKIEAIHSKEGEPLQFDEW
jgi:hypothetical protein